MVPPDRILFSRGTADSREFHSRGYQLNFYFMYQLCHSEAHDAGPARFVTRRELRPAFDASLLYGNQRGPLPSTLPLPSSSVP